MEWLAALRDHPERPAVAQRLVLVSLAQRMDWTTGCGYASTGTLAADADCGERTVRNATTWARKASMLLQTRRGHRRGDGRVIASEWQLCLPISTGSPVPVEDTSRDISTGKPGSLNRQMEVSQPAPPAPPSRTTSSSRTSSSSAFAGSASARPAQADTGIRRCAACGGGVEVDGRCSYCANKALDEPMPGIPPTPCCGRRFTFRELYAMDPGMRQLASSGEVVCGKPECLDADSACSKCGAELSDEPDSLCWGCLGISRDEVTR